MKSAPVCQKAGLRRRSWTPEEDRLLSSFINRYGHQNWRELPKHAGLSRCGKSCRLRWLNYLRPNLKRGNFSKEEDDTIVNFIEKFGNRWSVIAASLPGRSDNEIKNHWHTNLRNRTKQSTKLKEPIRNVGKLHAMSNSFHPDSLNLQILKSSPISPMLSVKACELSVSTSDLGDAVSENETSKNESEISSYDDIELDESFWTNLFSPENNQMWENPFLLAPFSPLPQNSYPWELPNSDAIECIFKQ